MFNDVDSENEILKWKLTEEEIKSVEGFANLSKEKIIAVMNFLVELAKLEIKIKEIQNDINKL